jgi:hypothetical protein
MEWYKFNKNLTVFKLTFFIYKESRMSDKGVPKEF